MKILRSRSPSRVRSPRVARRDGSASGSAHVETKVPAFYVRMKRCTLSKLARQIPVRYRYSCCTVVPVPVTVYGTVPVPVYCICFHSFYAEDVRAGPGVRSRSLGAAPRGVWTLDCSTGLCGHCHDKTATVARSPRHCTAEGAPWTERRVAHTGAAIMDCPAVHAGCHPGCLATCCCTLPP